MAPGPIASLDEPAATRDLRLAAGWRHIDLLERIGAGQAQRLLADQLAAEVAAARERLEPLRPWAGLSSTSYATYTSGNNQVRVARVLELIEPGERILDIGFGYGYLTTTIMKARSPAAYAGVELRPRFVDAALEGLRANQVPVDSVRLEVGDLYELQPEWVAEVRPDVVLLLEVLEHLPDVPRGFEVLGKALPPGTSVLFTVPMMGRLEGVMGHLSVFDRGRIEALCEIAGLTIQHVEALHNTWTLVLATASPDPPARLARLSALPEPAPSPAEEHGYTFREVELSGSSLDYRRSGRPRRGRSRVKANRLGVHCEVTPLPGASAPYYGGLAFAADAPAILRLQIEYERPEGIESVHVDGYDGDERVAAWTWKLGSRRPQAGERVVHLLKPGGGGRFTESGQADVGRIGRIEVYVELSDRAESASFRLRRAAYVSARESAQAAPSAA